MNNVGEKIYNLRKEKGVSQEELAFALNVSRQTVSRWETGSVNPSASNFESLCDFFGIADDYFLNDGEMEVKVLPKKENKATLDYKLFLLIMASVLLVCCIIACGFAGYLTIVPSEYEFLNNRSVKRFNCVGIVCVIIGILSLLALISLWIIAIKSKKKSKM